MSTDSKKMSKLMMELYANPELKEEFLNNPKKVLAEKGIEYPEDQEIKVVEETENLKYIILPYMDDSSEISTESLERKMSKTVLLAK
ncbi:MAG: NHLP leader peptide family RiPP precursor [Fidelibacterota bacterium]